MNAYVLLAICCIYAAQARPGHTGSGENHQLEGVPGVDAYGKTQYPHFDILELGEYSKGHLPPTTIVSNKRITIKIPQPYPVKVPYPVPHPVPVAKPYPVYQTKFVKVPHPVPYEVVKNVPVPVEVPKPYPVPANEHHASQESVQSGYGVPGHQQGVPLGQEQYAHYEGAEAQNQHQNFVAEYQNFGGQHSESDQSVRYANYEQPEQSNIEQQHIEEHYQEENKE